MRHVGLKAGHLSTLGLRDEPFRTMILVVGLLVEVMDRKTKLLTAAVLTASQNAIELILIHELLQIEIISYSKIAIFIFRTNPFNEGFQHVLERIMRVALEIKDD